MIQAPNLFYFNLVICKKKKTCLLGMPCPSSTVLLGLHELEIFSEQPGHTVTVNICETPEGVVSPTADLDCAEDVPILITALWSAPVCLHVFLCDFVSPVTQFNLSVFSLKYSWSADINPHHKRLRQASDGLSKFKVLFALPIKPDVCLRRRLKLNVCVSAPIFVKILSHTVVGEAGSLFCLAVLMNMTVTF